MDQECAKDSSWLIWCPFLHEFVYQLECLWKKEPGLKVIQMEVSQNESKTVEIQLDVLFCFA